jgi:hypothetical protein
MRRLIAVLAMLVAAVAVGVAAPSASASCGYTTPAFTVTETGNPFNGQCYHWPDTNRSDGTHTLWIKTGGPSWPAGWDAAIQAAANQTTFGPYRAAVIDWSLSGNPGCPNANANDSGGGGSAPNGGVPGSQQAYLCYGAYSYSCPGTSWVACTHVWVWGEWDSATGRYWTGPHIYTSEVDFRSNPVDVNGVPGFVDDAPTELRYLSRDGGARVRRQPHRLRSGR